MNPWLAKVAGIFTSTNVIGKGSLADQLVVDKDAKLKQEHDLDMSEEETERVALSTKTVDKIDAYYKMGRLILSGMNMLLSALVAIIAICYDQGTAAAVAAGGGPAVGTAYSIVKGKGNK